MSVKHATQSFRVATEAYRIIIYDSIERYEVCTMGFFYSEPFIVPWRIRRGLAETPRKKCLSLACDAIYV